MVTTVPSSYPPLSVSSKKRHIPDTEEIAGYLLTLKHRSVTPDPHSSDRPTVVSSVESQTQTSQYGSYQGSPDSPCGETPQDDTTTTTVDLSRMGTDGELAMPWEQLIGDSKLVSLQDRDLVPDSLFVAMAQMKPCRLQSADRVGCYKSRDLGFVGMCCMHCGGQPGFGRYYPNSVRSLAQTTTSQTILKHIGSKCQFCPPEIRKAILELQENQPVREGYPAGRPRYGSRKVFFQRIWHRLHGEETIKAMDAEESSSHQVNKTAAKRVPSGDVSVASSCSSQSDDEIARANAHVVTAKRPREELPSASYTPPPERYYPKRPKYAQVQQQPQHHHWAPPTAHYAHPTHLHHV